ncbi:MAG: sigma-E processing peptidase SpoIIGA [Clostridia bacterium]|nr:sigma-E processing peptidase SpoIIGA [Clostridia bacterium]
MTVVIEYVVLDNFLLDLLTALIVAEIMKVMKGFCFISAFTGTITALVYPIIPDYFIIPFKILSLIACVLPLCFKKRIKRSLGILALYVTISAVFSGVLQLFLNGSIKAGASYYSGGKVALISFAVIIAFYLLKQCVGLIKNSKAKSELVKIRIKVDNKEYDLKGFIDGGNMSRYRNSGLNFLSKDLSEVLSLKEIGETTVETVNGKSLEKVYVIDELKIYREGKEHIYRNVNAVKTEREFMDFDALLSRDFGEVDNDFSKTQEIFH